MNKFQKETLKAQSIGWGIFAAIVLSFIFLFKFMLFVVFALFAIGFFFAGVADRELKEELRKDFTKDLKGFEEDKDIDIKINVTLADDKDGKNIVH